MNGYLTVQWKIAFKINVYYWIVNCESSILILMKLLPLKLVIKCNWNEWKRKIPMVNFNFSSEILEFLNKSNRNSLHRTITQYVYNKRYIEHWNREKKYGCLTIDGALVTVENTIITHYSYASIQFVSFFSLGASALHHSVAISEIVFFLSFFFFFWLFGRVFFPPITSLSFVLRFAHWFLHVTFIAWKMYGILFYLPYCTVHIDCDSAIEK